MLSYNEWLNLLHKVAQTDEERNRAKEMAALWFRVVAELDWRVKRKGTNKNRTLGQAGRILYVADALVQRASEIAFLVDHGKPEPMVYADPLTSLTCDEIDTLVDHFPQV